MVKVLLLEDDKETLNHYREVVESSFESCQVFTATSGKKALSIVQKHNIDLMLLDMELDEEKKVLGLDYANMISCIQPEIDFIIISGYSNYLADAGDVEPFYYFMKPVNDAFLSRKLLEWELLCSKIKDVGQRTIKLVTESGMAIVPLVHICFLEKMGRKIRIKTPTKEYVCRDSIKNMMNRLDDHFYQVHQSYVVNMNHIESVEAKEDRTWSISFKSMDEEAVLSRYKAKDFFTVFAEIN